MPGSLTIGDFSRVTFLSVKTLRHYHRVGLLEPADVDPVTGYRRYTSVQIPIAQVIRRFRDLDMPLDDIRSVLRAPDQTTRSQLIAAHLARLEETLAETQRAVVSLRELLEHPSLSPVIEHRWIPATHTAAITSIVEIGDLPAWYQGAMGEIRGTLSAQGIVASGPPGGIYANELFTEERGDATLFFPVTGEVRPVGRVGPIWVPEARTGRHRTQGLPRRPGPLLRGAGDVRERTRPRGERSDPRVLLGRTAGRRRVDLEDRDLLADLRHRQGRWLIRVPTVHTAGGGFEPPTFGL